MTQSGVNIVIKVNASEDAAAATPSTLNRAGSWMWEWSQSKGSSKQSSPVASREASLHGGNLFAGMPSRESSVSSGNLFGPDGTTKMKRNVSFSDILPSGSPTRASGASSPTGSWIWDWNTASAPASKPASREPSLKGGSAFGPGSPQQPAMKRAGSWIWEWNTASAPASKPASRDPSLKGGSAFGPGSPQQPAMKRAGSWVWDWNTASAPASKPASRDPSLKGGSAFGPGSPQQPAMKRNLSVSALWDWSFERPSPNDTPDGSQHGGDESAPDVSDATEQTSALPYELPKALTKNLSIGTFLFDWGGQRVSPPHTRQVTPDPSLRDGIAS